MTDQISSATPISVNDYAASYEYRGDQDYVPTDGERAMIEDAIEGYLSDSGLASQSLELERAQKRIEGMGQALNYIMKCCKEGARRDVIHDLAHGALTAGAR